MISRSSISFGLAVLIAFGAVDARALTPRPPCLSETEGNMGVHDATIFGHGGSGYIVEDYSFVGGQDLTNFPKALQRFRGGRVVECRTGKIVAVNYKRGEELHHALSATEFLRGAVQNSKSIRFNDVQRAAKAVFPEDVIVLRETEETCGCNAYFPGLRPSSLAPYQQD